MVEVGRGRLSVAEMPGLMALRDRSKSGGTMPPHGLCLEEWNIPIRRIRWRREKSRTATLYPEPTSELAVLARKETKPTDSQVVAVRDQTPRLVSREMFE